MHPCDSGELSKPVVNVLFNMEIIERESMIS